MEKPTFVTREEVRNTDVICTRGNGVLTHKGNVFYHELIKNYQKIYQRNYPRSLSPKEKKEIVGNVIKTIATLNPPGRFLKISYEKGGGKSLGRRDSSGLVEVFHAIQDAEAISKKVSQALREKPKRKKRSISTVVKDLKSNEIGSCNSGSDKCQRTRAHLNKDQLSFLTSFEKSNTTKKVDHDNQEFSLAQSLLRLRSQEKKLKNEGFNEQGGGLSNTYNNISGRATKLSFQDRKIRYDDGDASCDNSLHQINSRASTKKSKEFVNPKNGMVKNRVDTQQKKHQQEEERRNHSSYNGITNYCNQKDDEGNVTTSNFKDRKQIDASRCISLSLLPSISNKRRGNDDNHESISREHSDQHPEMRRKRGRTKMISVQDTVNRRPISNDIVKQENDHGKKSIKASKSYNDPVSLTSEVIEEFAIYLNRSHYSGQFNHGQEEISTSINQDAALLLNMRKSIVPKCVMF